MEAGFETDMLSAVPGRRSVLFLPSRVGAPLSTVVDVLSLGWES